MPALASLAPARPPPASRYALTGKEVVSILMNRLVKIDGKVRTDKTYPVGFMDVIDIPKTGEQCPPRASHS
jgi:ribosomal protein S4E